MIIIGITGTIGAGKGTIVDYLTTYKAFKHYSVRDYLLEEISKRHYEPNRDSMVLVANSLRQQYGASFIIDELMKKALANNTNSVIESIRAEGEVISLRKQKEFYLLAVDALPEVRYQRIRLRSSETDNIDYQTFIQNEERERQSNDLNKQNLNKCIALADYFMTNNTTKSDLFKQLEIILQKIL